MINLKPSKTKIKPQTNVCCIAVPAQHKLAAARLKKGTAQWFRLSNSVRIFISLNWYDYNISITNIANILYDAYNYIQTSFFPGQLAFCKKAVELEGLAARRIFWIVQWSRVVLRKLKVYFPKHVLFIINAYAELSRSHTLLGFSKYVRKFKYKRDAHSFLWIRETFTHNIREGVRNCNSALFQYIFCLILPILAGKRS